MRPFVAKSAVRQLVVLHHHMAAIEVDVDAAGVAGSARASKGIFLNRHPLAGSGLDAAAATVHAVVHLATRTGNQIAAHHHIIAAAGLDAGVPMSVIPFWMMLRKSFSIQHSPVKKAGHSRRK